jgi:hypothetical protein
MKVSPQGAARDEIRAIHDDLSPLGSLQILLLKGCPCHGRRLGYQDLVSDHPRGGSNSQGQSHDNDCLPHGYLLIELVSH